MSQVKTKPDGMHSVTPHLVCAGASAAIEFYKKAFGAEELARLPGPDGKLMHAMIRIGDSPVMLVDEFPAWDALGPKVSRARRSRFICTSTMPMPSCSARSTRAPGSRHR